MNMNFIKQHWGAIVAALGVAGTYVNWNQVASFAGTHHTTTLGIILAAFLKMKQEKGFGRP